MTARLLKTFRFPPPLVDRLDRYARRNHRSRTAVVEMALEKLLSAAEAANGAPPDHLDLPRWLSRNLGVPVALCVSYVEGGRVTVDSEVHTGRMFVEGSTVRLDGELVVS